MQEDTERVTPPDAPSRRLPSLALACFRALPRYLHELDTVGGPRFLKVLTGPKAGGLKSHGLGKIVPDPWILVS